MDFSKLKVGMKVTDMLGQTFEVTCVSKGFAHVVSNSDCTCEDCSAVQIYSKACVESDFFHTVVVEEQQQAPKGE